jgi:hypothetical protein
MFIKSFAMATAGLALVAAPVAASAAPAASLSVSKAARSGSQTADKSKVGGDGGIIIIALAAIAVGGGLYLGRCASTGPHSVSCQLSGNRLNPIAPNRRP